MEQILREYVVSLKKQEEPKQAEAQGVWTHGTKNTCKKSLACWAAFPKQNVGRFQSLQCIGRTEQEIPLQRLLYSILKKGMAEN